MSDVFKVEFWSRAMHKLDPKGRVSIPADWRAALGQKLVLLQATHKKRYNILKCFTKEAFDQKINEIRTSAKELGATPGQIDEYVGSIISSADSAEVSTQGKILIPKDEREHLKVKEYVQFVGRGSMFEIWLPEDYNAEYSPEKLAENPLEKHFCMFT
ncbi:MAG: hypothetical protein IKT79_08135 [Akkermansia sp.]|nr:hypothetical protein [Akkermansia sp.]